MTAARLAELLAKHKDYLTRVSKDFIGFPVMEVLGNDWTEIV